VSDRFRLEHILVGGKSSEECFLNSVERYDTEKENLLWESIAPMSTIGPGVAVLDNLLYAVGGSDGQHDLRSSE
ncbi:hypothetical protein OSTOST_18957, partial [Ostertagia ostertagi]